MRQINQELKHRLFLGRSPQTVARGQDAFSVCKNNIYNIIIFYHKKSLMEAAFTLLARGKIWYSISGFHILMEVLRLMECCAALLPCE